MLKRGVCMRKIAPLSAGFTLTSMLGFLVTVLYVYPVSPTWGFTFAIIFVIMFIASFISITNAPVNDPAFYKELAIHEHNIKEEESFEQEEDKELDSEEKEESELEKEPKQETSSAVKQNKIKKKKK